MAENRTDLGRRQLRSPNFQRYVAELIDQMTIDQKERIPLDLRPALAEGGMAAVQKMDFETQLYVLHNILGRRVVVTVADENGMAIADFIRLWDGYRQAEVTPEMMQTIKDNSLFVLGSYDLVGMMEYYNMLSAGPTYRFLLSYKSLLSKPRKSLEQREEIQNAFEGLVRFLSIYERNRRRIKDYKLEGGIEWFLMLHLGYQQLKPNELQENWREKGHIYTPRALRLSLTRLVRMGLVIRQGVKKTIPTT